MDAMIGRLLLLFSISMVALSLAASPLLAADAPVKVQFAREILPLLSANCFTCHGPDPKERKAGLRLDVRAEAIKEAESGERAIVPGSAAKSELWRRISSTDRDVVMPPPKTQHSLTDAQKDKIRRWL